VAAGFAARAAAVGRLNALPPISPDAYARVNALRRSDKIDVINPLIAPPQTLSHTLQILNFTPDILRLLFVRRLERFVWPADRKHPSPP